MTSRRDFAKTLSAAALGYALRPLAPSRQPLAPRRKLDRIGLQLYTVRHQMEKDIEGTIARVAATGYREVEFAGYFGKSPRDVRALLIDGVSDPKNDVVDPTGVDVVAIANILEDAGGQPQRGDLVQRTRRTATATRGSDSVENIGVAHARLTLDQGTSGLLLL